MNTRDVEMMSAAANVNGHEMTDHDLEKSEGKTNDRHGDRNEDLQGVPGSEGLGVVDNSSSVDFSLKGVLRLGVESRGRFCYLLSCNEFGLIIC